MYQIEDYPYFVDEAGNVYREGKDTPLKAVVHADTGYLIVPLWKDNKPTIRYVHILVATYWVNNPDPMTKKFVNHINGNKQDPHKDNLEWINRSEDTLHPYGLGLRSKAPKRALTEYQADAAVLTILNGDTLKDIAMTLGVEALTLTRYVKASADRLNLTDDLAMELKRQKALRMLKAMNLRKRTVVQHSLNGEPINEFGSIQEAARVLGVNSGNITTCLKGRAKTCGGFKWTYK